MFMYTNFSTSEKIIILCVLCVLIEEILFRKSYFYGNVTWGLFKHDVAMKYSASEKGTFDLLENRKHFIFVPEF